MPYPFCFQWENISVTVKEKPASFFTLRSTAKVVVDDVSGYGNSNSLIAVFGSSGCGKTTFLGAISGRIQGKKGTLKMNGRLIANSHVRSISGYISQEDKFTETLTVHEHMRFMTALKFNGTKQERITKIDKLLTELSLDENRNTVLARLSGGERRRVSLATELISDPHILFCDEPTTGLDGFTALTVIQKLENVAMTGKLVLVTVHQPSSQLYDLFDNIILLANGKLIFQGSKLQAQSFFESANLYCPISYNPADFYLKCLSIDPYHEEVGKREIARLSRLFTKVKKTEEVKNDLNMLRTPHANENVSGKNIFFQLGWLIWRDYKDLKRNFYRYWTKYILLMITSLIISVAFSNVKLEDPTSVQDIQGVLLLIISELIYSHMYSVIHVFPEELYTFVWEKNVYSSFPYLVSKLLTLLPICFIDSFGFLLISFSVLQFMEGLDLFFRILTILFDTSLCGLCLGLCMSAIFSTADYIELFIVPFDLIVMTLSGIFIKIDTLPKFLGLVKYLSPFYFGFRSVSTLFWERVDHLANCTSEHRLPCYQNGEEVLKHYGFFNEYDDVVLYNTLFMCIIMSAYCYIGYLGIIRKRALYELY